MSDRVKARRKKNLSLQSSVEDVVETLKSDKRYRHSIVHHKYLPESPARYSEPEQPLPDILRNALKQVGIEKLYSHQVKALEAVRERRNVIVSTPTASGKTLIYNLPIMESCLADSETRAIYLYPLKALAQDQRRKIVELAGSCGSQLSLSAEIYDGDTSAYRRRKIRAEPPNIILTNPDMLHLSILAYHQNWEEFFRKLRYVVVDELHTYKGIFGAHFSGVLRRLRRICALYGSQPVFIGSSATIANPKEFSERLFATAACPLSLSPIRYAKFLSPPVRICSNIISPSLS